MYCRKCGKEINDDAYVCIYCGAKAHETPEEKPANTGYAGAGYASYGSYNTRERICQDDFFNFSKLNKPAEKKSS